MNDEVRWSMISLESYNNSTVNNNNHEQVSPWIHHMHDHNEDHTKCENAQEKFWKKWIKKQQTQNLQNALLSSFPCFSNPFVRYTFLFK